MKWLILLSLVYVASAGLVETGCDHPGDIQNGGASGSPSSGSKFGEGETVTYECNSGYRLEGKRVLTCSEVSTFNFAWDANPPSCEQITCGSAPAITNGQVSQSATPSVPGTTAWYDCDNNFILRGNNDIPCQDSGEWGAEPYCEASRCGGTPAINNGRYRQDTSGDEGRDIGDGASIRCNDGYEPADGSNIVCQADPNGGNPSWSPLSSCEDKTCPTIEQIPDSTVYIAPGADYAVIKVVAPNATDNSGEDPTVVCDPVVGDYPAELGPCKITCTATDEANNLCSIEYTITVEAPAESPASSCPDGYDAFEGRCFQVVKRKNFFDSACKICGRRQNGYLAFARNAEESEQVADYLKLQDRTQHHWFNLHQQCRDNVWQTVGLDQVRYDGWRRNPGSGDCGTINASGTGGKRWGKECCYTKLAFVCEADPN